MPRKGPRETAGVGCTGRRGAAGRRDPLAAALAAGETPSPELVAASGEEGTLPAKVGIPLLLALFVLAAGAAWFGGRQAYTAVVPFPYSAEVLATKAQEMLGRLGYAETPADAGFGFSTDTRYLDWLRARDTSRTRWQQLASVRPAVAQFWYRTSPKLFEPTELFTGLGGAVLRPNDPPLDTAGMTMVSLDLNGRLTYLKTVMPDREGPAAGVAEADWSRLFAESGLDMATFRAVAPEWKAPAGADARAAWVSSGADWNGASLRIEAASHRGRPMYFEMFAPWTEPATGSHTAPRARASQSLSIALILVIFGLAILLAIGNARSGRADKRGAMRVAFALGLALLARSVLESRWAFSLDLILSMLVGAVSWAAYVGLVTWTFYTALEPYARRRWPQMLVSWNRLLEGRWRDPLVGRDLLVGSVISAAVGLAEMAFSSTRNGQAIPVYATKTWMGLGSTVASIPGLAGPVLWTAFGVLLLLVGSRIVLRKEWLAMAAVVVIGAAPALVRGAPAVRIALTMVFTGAMVLVATRFGLVALLAIVGLRQLAQYGMSLTPPPPLVGPMVLVIVVALAPAVFGYYTSRARRPAASATWFDG